MQRMIRALWPLGSSALVLSALLLAACDDGDGSTDAGAIRQDAAPGSDAGTASDAGPADAGAPNGVRGRVTYDRRPFQVTGLGAAVPEPAAGVVVALLEDGVEVERTVTDADGAYVFARGPGGTLEVRVLAQLGAHPVSLLDFADGLYAFRAPVGDVHVSEDELAGSLAIAATVLDGLAVAAEAFERTEPFPNMNVYWERGRVTPYGTSYALGPDLWILGGPNDTDEYDTPVLLHELGHYLQDVYPYSDTPDGDPHAGAATDPRLAWNEGWPTFFSCLVRDSATYGDTIDGDIALLEDLDALPMSGEYVARPGRPQSQTLSEWIISGSLWHLYHADADRAQQLRRSFDPLTGWLDDPGQDRGFGGRDFVDYLDGYLCLGGEPQRADIQAYVVNERRFPYDLSPACPKPGRPMAPWRAPPPVTLPGHRVRDGDGRWLHEVFVGRVETPGGPLGSVRAAR